METLNLTGCGDLALLQHIADLAAAQVVMLQAIFDRQFQINQALTP